ncbi:linker for activation of T-cells family member 1 isoform X2 [Brachyhypopomus gauderio]|uniref:linker for activation of T-cells family member 1 isoform X2 n=1 Tax=Brachyhypopomus gauderio TaxID=698409 RepID=UPI0040434240
MDLTTVVTVVGVVMLLSVIILTSLCLNCKRSSQPRAKYQVSRLFAHTQKPYAPTPYLPSINLILSFLRPCGIQDARLRVPPLTEVRVIMSMKRNEMAMRSPPKVIRMTTWMCYLMNCPHLVWPLLAIQFIKIWDLKKKVMMSIQTVEIILIIQRPSSKPQLDPLRVVAVMARTALTM